MPGQIGTVDLSQLRAGAWVRLLKVPTWLTHDLPADEATRVQACLGQRMRVADVDAHGYIWLSADAQSAAWFCVQRADVEAEVLP